jgi:acyl-CoA thioesterase I
MKLVCIGDSITVGYGVSKEDTWVTKVQRSFKINIINKGINGDTTSGMLSRSFKDVVEEKPDFVFIMGGCNDLLSNRSLKMIEDNICELIDEAIKYNITPIIGIEPPIIGVMASVHWNTDCNYSEALKNQVEYNNWLLSYCKKQNIKSVDFFKLFSDNLKHTDPKKLFIDGIHPSILGHKLMANLLIKELSTLFQDK